MPAAEAAAPTVRPRKRWRRCLFVLLALAGLSIALPWLLPPERLADLLLRQTGPGLQLHITRSGPAAWRLRGGPMLEVHGLEIRQIGADHPWLEADRVLLAVPWETVRSLGKTLVLTRMELDAPRLNLPLLLRWLDRRTPGNAEIPLPILSNGLALNHGQLHADAWTFEDISLQLAEFSPQVPVRSVFSGQYTDQTTQARFDLRLAMTRPALPAGAAIVGSVDIRRDHASIPARFTLSAPVRSKDGHWSLPALRLALQGEWSQPGVPPLPFALNLDGALDFDQHITCSPFAFELTGAGPLPSLHAEGDAIFADGQLQLHLSGEMPQWPRAWPTLPKPLNRQHRLDFTMDYTGALDWSGRAHLQLQRGPTRLDASLHPSQLAQWFSHLPSSPLPPLQGHLSAPRLELPGVTLHGIEIKSEP